VGAKSKRRGKTERMLLTKTGRHCETPKKKTIRQTMTTEKGGGSGGEGEKGRMGGTIERLGRDGHFEKRKGGEGTAGNVLETKKVQRKRRTRDNTRGFGGEGGGWV